MNIREIFKKKPQLTRREKCSYQIVVVPYAGDIAPGKEKEFEDAQRKALDELAEYINNGYEECGCTKDEGIHALVYMLSKTDVYYE